MLGSKACVYPLIMLHLGKDKQMKKKKKVDLFEGTVASLFLFCSTCAQHYKKVHIVPHQQNGCRCPELGVLKKCLTTRLLGLWCCGIWLLLG